MRCRLCNSVGKLVKAHIIPEAFFRVMRTGDEAPLIVTDVSNSFPKRSPIGVYDENILCKTCEPKFDRLDSYGTDVLLNQKVQLFRPIQNGEQTIAFQADGVDQMRLLQFFVATLWRASVSTHAFYNRVRLGPFEDIAKNTILNQSQLIPADFGAVLSCWNITEDQQAIANGIMDPFAERWKGVNSYRVYFGQVVAYIKVDRRPFPAPLNKFSLLGQRHVTLVNRDLSGSNDFNVMIKTVERSHENVQKMRVRRQ